MSTKKNTWFFYGSKRLIFIVTGLLTYTLLNACSVHTSAFKNRNRNVNLTNFPASAALIRFDFDINMPNDMLSSDDDYSTTDNFFDDDNSSIMDGFFDDEDFDLADNFTSEVDNDIHKAFFVYFGILSAIEKTSEVRKNLKKNNTMDFQNNVTSQRDISSHTEEMSESASPSPTYSETVTDKNVVNALKAEYDAIYQLIEDRVVSDLGVPLADRNTAQGWVPFDDMGYPLGNIKPQSIPDVTEAGLAIAVLVDNGWVRETRTTKGGKKSWQPIVTVLVEMIDKKGKLLWSKKVRRKVKAEYVIFYHRNYDDGSFKMVRKAGPNLHSEIALAIQSIGI